MNLAVLMYSAISRKSFTTISALMLLLAIVALSLVSSWGHAPQSMVILDREPSLELAGHFDHYDDASGKLTLADILDQKNAISFTPLKGNLNDGYSHKAVWLRFTIFRTSRFPANAWLRLYPPYIDHITACIQTGHDPYSASSYRQIQLGDHIPVAERPIMDTDFLIPLLLPAEKPVTVYVKIQSISSLTFAGSLHTSADMVRQTNINVLLQSGYLTITLVVTLLNLIFFLRVGDRLFLYFSLYAFAIFINYISISGLLSIILPLQVHLFSDYLADLGKGGGILLFSIFFNRLFASELTQYSRLYLKFMTLVGALTILADPLGFYIEMAPITSMSVLILFFLINWLSFKAVKKNKPGSRFFFITLGISNLGYFLHFLKLLGWVPLEWWNINNIQFASLINMVLMTLALIERLRETEKLAMDALRASDLKALALSTKLEVERVAKERLQQFLAMLSHEYRTPLAIIHSSLDIVELQNKEQLSASNRDELDKMRRSVKRLVEVMDISLEKSRLSDSLEKEKTKRILLEPFMVSELAEIRVLWPKRTFIYSSSLSGHEIMAEPHLFKIALFNILDNAQKYSPSETSIKVDCCEEGGYVVIKIINQDSGIMEDDHEQLFEKYQRGSNSNNTSGSGVGLWLVRTIIEQYHGTVTLENNAQSITVTLRLPLSQAFNSKP